MRRATLGLALVALITSMLPACSAPARPGVIVYGDSLVWESATAIRRAYSATGKTWRLHVDAFPGTAACDPLRLIRSDIAKGHARLVVLAFAGNTHYECMEDAHGVPFPPGSAAYYDAYHRAYQKIFAITAELGVDVLYLNDPPPGTDAQFAEHIAADARVIARRYANVSFSPALDLALTRDGAFAARLPCLPTEHAAQGCRDGTIAVRSPDELHLCPIASMPRLCHVYSSGELRYGRAMAAAISRAIKSVS
jgi:hypothetical protein